MVLFSVLLGWDGRVGWKVRLSWMGTRINGIEFILVLVNEVGVVRHNVTIVGLWECGKNSTGLHEGMPYLSMPEGFAHLCVLMS